MSDLAQRVREFRENKRLREWTDEDVVKLVRAELEAAAQMIDQNLALYRVGQIADKIRERQR